MTGARILLRKIEFDHLNVSFWSSEILNWYWYWFISFDVFCQFLKNFYVYIFNWHIIALQCCISFCYTTILIFIYNVHIIYNTYMCVCMLHHFSHVQLCVTLWIVAHQALLSMGFSREEYWSGLPCPPPGDLPDPGIEPVSLASPALAGGFFATSTTWEATCG